MRHSTVSILRHAQSYGSPSHWHDCQCEIAHVWIVEHDRPRWLFSKESAAASQRDHSQQYEAASNPWLQLSCKDLGQPCLTCYASSLVFSVAKLNLILVQFFHISMLHKACIPRTLYITTLLLEVPLHLSMHYLARNILAKDRSFLCSLHRNSSYAPYGLKLVGYYIDA